MKTDQRIKTDQRVKTDQRIKTDQRCSVSLYSNKSLSDQTDSLADQTDSVRPLRCRSAFPASLPFSLSLSSLSLQSLRRSSALHPLYRGFWHFRLDSSPLSSSIPRLLFTSSVLSRSAPQSARHQLARHPSRDGASPISSRNGKALRTDQFRLVRSAG